MLFIGTYFFFKSAYHGPKILTQVAEIAYKMSKCLLQMQTKVAFDFESTGKCNNHGLCTFVVSTTMMWWWLGRKGQCRFQCLMAMAGRAQCESSQYLAMRKWSQNEEPLTNPIIYLPKQYQHMEGIHLACWNRKFSRIPVFYCWEEKRERMRKAFPQIRITFIHFESQRHTHSTFPLYVELRICSLRGGNWDNFKVENPYHYDEGCQEGCLPSPPLINYSSTKAKLHHHLVIEVTIRLLLLLPTQWQKMRWTISKLHQEKRRPRIRMYNSAGDDVLWRVCHLVFTLCINGSVLNDLSWQK